MTHWDMILMEGDLRCVLSAIEEKRKSNPDMAYCLQISVDATPDGIDVEMSMKGTVEELTRDIIREMHEKGQV